MASRLRLHDEFITILGFKNVYFQPPPSVLMSYPAIRYSMSTPNVIHANNAVYTSTKCYEGVVIDRNPDSEIADKLLKHFSMISLGKPYVADNLNHFPFTIYY